MITLHHHFEEIKRVTRLEVQKRLTHNLSMASRIAEMRGGIDRIYNVVNQSILRDQIQLAEMVGAVSTSMKNLLYHHQQMVLWQLPCQQLVLVLKLLQLLEMSLYNTSSWYMMWYWKMIAHHHQYRQRLLFQLK